MQDIQITMATGLAPGEEWEVKYNPIGGAVQLLTPNPVTNPFTIPNQDETLCYVVQVRKKCIGGTFGEWKTINVGECQQGNALFSVEHNGIDGLITGTGPAVYTIGSGTFPLNINEQINATHMAYSGDIIVNISGLQTGHVINVAVAGNLVSTTQASNGTNTIPNISFAANEIVFIQLTSNT